MDNTEIKLPHKMILEERSRLNLTGATEVIHFDGDAAEINTSLGRMIVEGHDLQLKCLSLEEGALVITGTVSCISYEEPKRRKGFFQ